MKCFFSREDNNSRFGGDRHVELEMKHSIDPPLSGRYDVNRGACQACNLRHRRCQLSMHMLRGSRSQPPQIKSSIFDSLCFISKDPAAEYAAEWHAVIVPKRHRKVRVSPPLFIRLPLLSLLFSARLLLHSTQSWLEPEERER